MKNQDGRRPRSSFFNLHSCRLVIGVTGATGSGKTSAAAAFAELGAKTVALDAIGHELLTCPEVSEEVRRTFSSGVFRILDGEVSRRKLADVVFEDAGELDKLGRILHPRMVERVRSEVERWRRQRPTEATEVTENTEGKRRSSLPKSFTPLLPSSVSSVTSVAKGEEGRAALVIEGALLLEMGLDGLCDRVVLVRAPRELRLLRLARSRGWDESELARRERAQQGEERARARADAVIENASTLEEMRRRIGALWEEWK